ncbi:MAG TPA: STAS domain-containing protein [Thermoanaerobaculia bacterium]|nr:STAS domain-containing protein [Thermoanaerobaculia bacterium]
MLRIETRSETTDAVTYALAGQLTQEHLEELRDLVKAARSEGRRVTLDLAGVVLVDRELVRFFACGNAKGVELVHCPAYVLSWIRCEGEEEERKTS